MKLLDALARHEGVAHLRTMYALGVTEAVIRSARRSGAVWCPRRGWIASAAADPTVLAAVTAGGRVGCATQAERLGLWMLEPAGLHLSLPRHSGHARPPEGALAHWRGGTWRAGTTTADPVHTVVRDLVDCLPREAAICSLDSALQSKLVGPARMRALLASTRRGGSLVELLDGRAESGLESLVRLRLAAAGIRATPQHVVSGVGRIDLIVGDRLLIECDGRAHHDDALGRARDRARDLALLARGYVVVRLDVRQIHTEWALTLAVIRAIIGRNEHLWSAAHRRAGLTGG